MLCMLMHLLDHSGHNAHAAQPGAPHNEPLLDILKRRYALGEITEVQFEDMKRVLGLSDVAPNAPSPLEHSHH